MIRDGLLDADADQQPNREGLRDHEWPPADGHAPCNRSPEERNGEDGGDVAPVPDGCGFESEEHVPRHPST